MRKRSGRRDTGMEESEQPGRTDGFVQVGTQRIAIEAVQRAIRVGQHAADLCDANHPVTSPGYLAWMETNGVFRREHCARPTARWTRNDEQNIPRIVSPDGKVTITCAAGNNDTGLTNGHASTRRPRGPAGISIINRSKVQVEFVELLPEGQRGVPVLVNQGMYFLLWNRVGDTMRNEISLARSVTADGTLIDWAQRIILPEFDLYEDGRSGGGGGPVVPATLVDVPVERLAS